jgi:hypothetical protein
MLLDGTRRLLDIPGSRMGAIDRKEAPFHTSPAASRTRSASAGRTVMPSRS